ncbi:hypothetical protein GCM10023188_02360 [Pontibacter saemangeumensis]|uniref:2Fe-2S ferredoxin-type domain-containing protein n=1 Tax=Pontibacter saemangeumensis TaxID=1084525 RepID=A0ABP8L624_9BACT
MKKDIKVTVRVYGQEHVLETYDGEYRNLMMLLYDKIYIDEFGECKGVGRCGTCHVHVLRAPAGLVFHDGVEHTTLSRLGNTNETSHLACQIMVDRHINGLEVEVVEGSGGGY